MKLKNQFLLFILKSLTLYTLKTHFLITTFVMCDAGVVEWSKAIG